MGFIKCYLNITWLILLHYNMRRIGTETQVTSNVTYTWKLDKFACDVISPQGHSSRSKDNYTIKVTG